MNNTRLPYGVALGNGALLRDKLRQRRRPEVAGEPPRGRPEEPGGRREKEKEVEDRLELG